MTKVKKAKWKAAFFCKCPACGKGKLLKSILKFHDNCENCGIELSKYETADGPAFFGITIVGTLLGIAAAVVEIVYEPEVWVHFALWIPLTFICSITIMRVTKGLMAAHQYELGHSGMKQ